MSKLEYHSVNPYNIPASSDVNANTSTTSVQIKSYSERNRNFWAYYLLVLVVINLLFLIPALLQSSKLELLGIPVLINLYFIFSALPFVIVILIWPIKILKNIINTIASFIFIPIILLYIFFTVGVPVLSNQIEQKNSQIESSINNKSFIPLAFHDTEILLPGNIIFNVMYISSYKQICQFRYLFLQEVIEKKEPITIIIPNGAYTSTFIADKKEPWLSEGQKYIAAEGNIKLGDQLINSLWLNNNIQKSEQASNCTDQTQIKDTN